MLSIVQDTAISLKPKAQKRNEISSSSVTGKTLWSSVKQGFLKEDWNSEVVYIKNLLFWIVLTPAGVKKLWQRKDNYFIKK